MFHFYLGFLFLPIALCRGILIPLIQRTLSFQNIHSLLSGIITVIPTYVDILSSSILTQRVTKTELAIPKLQRWAPNISVPLSNLHKQADWELRKGVTPVVATSLFWKAGGTLTVSEKGKDQPGGITNLEDSFLKNFQCHSCCMTQLVTQLIQMIPELGPNFSITFRWVRRRLALWMWPDLDYIAADAHILMLGYYLVVVPWKCGAKIWSHKVYAQVVRFGWIKRRTKLILHGKQAV
jgi:hypothetical protein